MKYRREFADDILTKRLQNTGAVAVQYFEKRVKGVCILRIILFAFCEKNI